MAGLLTVSCCRSAVSLCLVYMVSWRATWAALPWSVVLGCWVTLFTAMENVKVHFAPSTSCQYIMYIYITC